MTPVWPGTPQSALDRWAAALGVRRRGNTISAPCPVHQGTKPNLTISVKNDHRLVAHCFSQHCQDAMGYHAFASELERITGLRLSPDHRTHPFPRPANPTPQPAPPVKDQQAVNQASRIWNNSERIPTSPEHPARKWLNHRNLWRPQFPAPDTLRWLPFTSRDNPDLAGFIIAPAAGPQDWLDHWPSPPAPEGVQRIPIDAHGNPAGAKLSKGAISGNVFIAGRPEPNRETSVTEGVADALAIASRQPGPVICTLGTAGMHAADRTGLAQWLAAAASGITIWADRDTGKKERAPAGLQAAYKLRHHIRAAGADAQVCHATQPHKDPAEAAAHTGFPSISPDFGARARQLAAQHPLWPRWCIALTADLDNQYHRPEQHKA